jgi:hypothetical protein
VIGLGLEDYCYFLIFLVLLVFLFFWFLVLFFFGAQSFTKDGTMFHKVFIVVFISDFICGSPPLPHEKSMGIDK